MTRGPARTAALAAASSLALALTGCGHSSRPPTPGLLLRQQTLVTVAHSLASIEPSIEAETAAARAAWPAIAAGLPLHPSAAARSAIAAAASASASLTLPSIYDEQTAPTIAGPAAALVSLVRGYRLLSGRSWAQVQAALKQVHSRSRREARFVAANIDLYIGGIYDAHFGLAQIGRKLLDAYKNLKGPEAFGEKLTLAEVEAIAAAYSEAKDQLTPHPELPGS